MSYFDTYFSNTLAGSGNQTFFISDDPGEIRTGRLYYRLFAGGEYDYSILFSNTVDTTFSDGSHSVCNTECDEWDLISLSASVCDRIGHEVEFLPFTFGGKSGKRVQKGEMFHTDPLRLSAEKGQYICLEISFRGRMIPYHEETLIPTFLLEDGAWKPSKLMPFASMIGCDREVKRRISFVGDSITQGIGTEIDSYTHWNAYLSEMLGEDNAYWNLGLGFARASDLASDGAWMKKATKCDTAFLCLGVNDLLQGANAEDIKQSIARSVSLLRESGCEVILQTLPPFDYDESHAAVWNEVNEYIKNLGGTRVFDVVPLLSVSEEKRHLAAYGGHPNAAGCRIWAESLYKFLT